MAGFARWPGLVVLSLCLLLPLAPGCGESIGDVSGEVKVKETKVATGTIAFMVKGRKTKVRTAAIKDGKYTVAGVPVGEATVTVDVPNLPADPKAKGKGKEPKMDLSKYADAKKSPLKHTVTAGEQNKDFTLEP